MHAAPLGSIIRLRSRSSQCSLTPLVIVLGMPLSSLVQVHTFVCHTVRVLCQVSRWVEGLVCCRRTVLCVGECTMQACLCLCLWSWSWPCFPLSAQLTTHRIARQGSLRPNRNSLNQPPIGTSTSTSYTNNIPSQTNNKKICVNYSSRCFRCAYSIHVRLL